MDGDVVDGLIFKGQRASRKEEGNKIAIRDKPELGGGGGGGGWGEVDALDCRASLSAGIHQPPLHRPSMEETTTTRRK